MMGYSRYRGASNLTSILEWAAIVGAVAGLLLALIGFSTGGIFGAFGRGDPPILARIISMAPGVGITLACLFMFVVCTATRASIDTAELTRKMWLHMSSGGTTQTTSATSREVADRIQIQGDAGNTTSKVHSAGQGFDENGVREFKGHEIVYKEGRYFVGNERFWSLGKAKDYINGLVS
jgi:hypothetical protein